MTTVKAALHSADKTATKYYARLRTKTSKLHQDGDVSQQAELVFRVLCGWGWKGSVFVNKANSIAMVAKASVTSAAPSYPLQMFHTTMNAIKATEEIL